MAVLLFLVLLAAHNAAILADQEVSPGMQSTCFLNEAGDPVVQGTCAFSDVPDSTEAGEFRCEDVEESPGYCPHDTFYKEGSLCFHSLDQYLVFECRAGKWTQTDSLLPAHRQKRFWWFVAAVVGVVACAFFCGGGNNKGSSSSGPPPNRPPSIFCPSSPTVTAPAGKTEAIATWSKPTASDPDGGQPQIHQRSGPGSGSSFKQGKTYITYEAKDAGGLTDTCYFYVTVKVTTCSVLRTPRYGLRPSCSGAVQDNIYGSTCTFSCEDGYVLQGQRSLACTQSGSWSHADPQCKAKSCGDPGTVTGGTVNCPGENTYRDVCSITCNAGYRHSGSVFTTCRADGSWSPPLQGCYDTTVPTFTNGCPPDLQQYSGPLGAAVTLTWTDPVTSDNSGGSVTLTSQPVSGSSFPPGLHRVTITAADPAGNKAFCSFSINVQVRRCPFLSVSNGRVTCGKGYIEGSVCDVTCNQGYRIQGQPSLTCTDTETWTPAVPTCSMVTCPSPPTIQAGGLICPTGNRFQSFCLLTCMSGYTAQSPRFVTCSADGTWTLPGTCLDSEPPSFQDGCPDNVEVFAARIGEETTADWTEPAVSDNSGETIVPTSDVTSGSSFPVGVTYVTYTASDSSNNSRSCRFPVTVTTLSCDKPDFEDPGRSRSVMLYDCPDGYIHGAECTLNCTNGYPFLGSHNVTCERDDNENPPRMFWNYDGTKPECRENNCSKLGEPVNGALACLLGNHGWDCFMSCNDNWDIVASFDGRFVCTNSESFWRPSTVPACQVAYIPGRARLPSELYYFTGSCDMSLGQIRSDFVAALSNSTWRDACVNVPTCTVENVQVYCGPQTRRKRSAETELRAYEGHARKRRQTILVLRVSFDMVMDFQKDGTSEETYQAYKSKEMQVWAALKSDAENGQFDLGSLTPDAKYTKYPSLTFDCPAGTKFNTRSGPTDNTKASCVGCSKGNYLSDKTECKKCEKGQYTELDNATSCTPCPPGQTTLSEGADNRTLCKDKCTAGYFSPSGLVPCLPCPPGSYQSRDEAVTCDLCPPGTWTSLAASAQGDDCVAADVHLTTDATLRGTMTSSHNSVTMTTWFRLGYNSSAVISIIFGDLTQNPLRILTFTEYSEDIWTQWNDRFSVPPLSMLEVVQDQWERVVVSVSESSEVTVYHNNTRAVTFDLPRALTSVAGDVESLILRGKGAISGVRAEARAMSQGEVTTSFSSCTGNDSSNILTVRPRPSSVHLPSICDAVDDCQSSPCSSHGVCENQVDGFRCQCEDGWTGTTCEVPPDVCYQNQCQNSATCVPSGDNYTCSCGEQHSGDRCQFEKVHGEWGDWASWSQCSATCGGVHERQRLCNNPSPLHGGTECTGQGNQTQSCGESVCKVDGGWGNWTDWTGCSGTCGGGKTTRTRQCNNPTPQNGGALCEGEDTDEESCGTVVCPVHGGFGNWSQWTSCSTTCGDGIQSRERLCDNPVPANGGDPCSGQTNQTLRCNLATCPECTLLPRSEGTDFNCTLSTDPDRWSCKLVCALGYSSPLRHAEYTCGQETEYMWNFERNGTLTTKYDIPICTRMKTATSVTSTTTVPYSNTDCSQRNEVANAVQQNLQQLPCLQDNICVVDVKGECVTGDDSNGSGRRKRSGGSTAVVVKMDADFGNSVRWDPNDNSSIIDYARKFASVDQSAAQVAINDTETLFTVTSNNAVISPDVTEASYSAFVACPPGSSAVDGGCVDCPPGFYEESGQCVLCPLGQYQDQPTSTTCKPCPDDLSWDVMGANDVTQCRYPRRDIESTDNGPNSDGTTPNSIAPVPASNNKGLLIGGIVGGFIVIAAVIGVVTFFVMKSKKASRISDIYSTQRPASSYDNDAYEGTNLPPSSTHLGQRA
ncbi:uncharacterized protein [Littorina saxatilis]|uniref:uncharacterized protein isoform X1 n=1 Tax=Littorina saxatilis TaxID=31220 RepID=UPI0038B5B540